MQTGGFLCGAKSCRPACFAAGRKEERFDGLFGEINRGLREASKVRFIVRLEST